MRHRVPGRPNRFEIDLVPYGLHTHLDVPDDPRAHEYIAWQIECYARVCAGLKQLGIDVPVKMVASSAVLRYTRDAAMDAVDPGHILFGQTPPWTGRGRTRPATRVPGPHEPPHPRATG